MEFLGLDAKIYPECAAYLARLPRGLESYPECTTSTAFLNFAWKDLQPLVEILPETLCRRLKGPWADGAWIPATHVVLATLLMRDVGSKSVVEYEQRIFDLNYRMFASNAFRAMMRVLSPNLLLLGASKRWGTFYKGGCSLTTVKGEKKSADLRLDFPAHLFPATYVAGLGATFRAAIACTRSTEITSKVLDTSDCRALIRVTWS